MTKTHKIQWLNLPGYKGETWNPIIGCNKISDGCQNCYAEKMARRLSAIALSKPDENTGFDVSGIGNYAEIISPTGKWNGTTRRVQNAINKPLHWKKPRVIFVCSMGDLFHESVPDKWIESVFHTMWAAKNHIFIVLTKRAQRMHEFLFNMHMRPTLNFWTHPLKNVWLGVTAENQLTFNKRISYLHAVPASVRFVSMEPLLGPISIYTHINIENKPDWVITGGESGHNARPMHPDWVRDIGSQCKDTGVPFFFKQWGEYEYTHQSDLYQSQSDGVIWPSSKYYKWQYKDENEACINGGGLCFRKVGKHRSGGWLDGVKHEEYPEFK